jgi:glycosyltransferase involved in cell wall biosynthesis
MSLPPKQALRVIHLMRAEAPVFSIERVFRDVRAHLPPEVSVTVWQCPYPSRGILPRLRGAWAARKLRADVLHVTGDAHYLTAFLPRRRSILTIHDLEFITRACGLKRFVLWLFWLRLPVRRVTAVTAISEETRQDLLSQVALDLARVEVIPNPVSAEFTPDEVPLPDPAQDPVQDRPVRVLQIGTKHNKNVERLAQALSGLSVSLFIVGKPSEAQKEALTAAKVPFTWQTGLDDAELVSAYRKCDILAFCSTSEGFGLPIIEAQSIGRPVVTSDRNPMRNVAGGAAFLTDPTSPEDMHRAFARLVADPTLRADLVLRGFANADRYRADTIAGRYAGLYQRIAQQAPEQASEGSLQL